MKNLMKRCTWRQIILLPQIVPQMILILRKRRGHSHSHSHQDLLLLEDQEHFLLAILRSKSKNQICKYSTFLYFYGKFSFHWPLNYCPPFYTKEFFQEAGEVVDVKFGMGRDDGSFRGFGHILFASPVEAQMVRVIFAIWLMEKRSK